MSYPNHPPHRGIVKIDSASRLVSTGNFASPLAQLSLNGNPSFAGPSKPPTDEPPPPVPPLQFNLFRTPSVYSTTSTHSLDSLSTISADERAFNNDNDHDAEEDSNDSAGYNRYEPPSQLQEEDPATPRAGKFDQSSDYFASGACTLKKDRLDPVYMQAGPSRPSRPSRDPSPSGIGSAHPMQVNTSFPLTKDVVEAQVTEQPVWLDDMASLHGEEGSEWGEDEADFEWLDNQNAPVAPNGQSEDSDGKQGSNTSPSKGFGGKIRQAVVSRGNSLRQGDLGNGEPRKLRKNLVFPRRAPPPPPIDVPPAPPLPRLASPNLQAQPIHSRLGEPVLPNPNLQARPLLPSRGWTDSNVQRGALTSRDLFIPPNRENRNRPSPSPLMVPMKSDGGGSSTMVGSGSKSVSHMSMQSAAYSFYDLDSPGVSTPRATTPTARTFNLHGQNENRQIEEAPQGRYAKVSVSKLEREREARERSASEPRGRRSMEEEPYSPEGFLAKGIEERGKGDFPRSAWYFMKAAEGGSATGRMYWGLALRHGWGVARDEKRAFVELRQACHESLAEGGLNFHQSPGAAKLTLTQKKTVTRDLSLGMFEIANCFLDGSGVKKAPDVALSYLRFAANLGDIAAQEQLGFLLSKGGNGIKKDMKESAKWYRMAVGQGSANTFGLAWIWKEKYM